MSLSNAPLATIILNQYSRGTAKQLGAAITDVCSPSCTNGFASSGIYIFWDIAEREALYIGLAIDLGLRFNQHNGFKPCPREVCKLEHIMAYFAGHAELGYILVAIEALHKHATGCMVALQMSWPPRAFSSRLVWEIVSPCWCGFLMLIPLESIQRITISRVASLLPAALGLLVVVGWAFGVSWIKNLRPSAVAMKATTAVGSLLSGVNLCLLDAQSSLCLSWIKPNGDVDRRIPAPRQLGLVCRWVAKRSGGQEMSALQAAALDLLVRQRIR